MTDFSAQPREGEPRIPAMSGYADKPSEQAENPRAAAWLHKVANGNRDAFAWCWSLWNFSQMLDDLVDGDKPVTCAEAAHSFSILLVTLSINPFHLEHARHLLPLMISACSRWVRGDEIAQAGNKELARGVRCGEIDLFLQVAFITGGWQHMQDCARAAGYDKEN